MNIYIYICIYVFEIQAAYELQFYICADSVAAGCKFVFAFETQTFLLEADMCLYVASTRNIKSVVFDTGAKCAFQHIGHIGRSLGLG